MTARLLSVNVVHELVPGPGGPTAIDKRGVDGPVEVGPLGLTGDVQAHSNVHGGPDKAVYAYAAEAAGRWARRLDREITPGTFGENLTTEGLDVDGALIGERWRIGAADTGVVLEVRMPRTPCENLEARMGVPRFMADFAATGEVGAYCKVLQPGSVQAGDPVVVVSRPDHDVTVRVMMTGATAYQLRALLEAGLDLAPQVKRRAQRATRSS